MGFTIIRNKVSCYILHENSNIYCDFYYEKEFVKTEIYKLITEEDMLYVIESRLKSIPEEITL